MAEYVYSQVSIAFKDEAYIILLDGKPLQIKGKPTLRLTNKYHAELVAAEWRTQIKNIKLSAMPCTHLLSTVAEQTPKQRTHLMKQMRKYAETDLLCYRTRYPADLSAQQAQAWDPWLDWAQAFGIQLLVTDTIKVIEQPQKALTALDKRLRSLEDIDLALCAYFTALYGSVILGLAVTNRAISAQEAWALSRLDEHWQQAQWGKDAQAVARDQTLKTEMLALAAFVHPNADTT